MTFVPNHTVSYRGQYYTAGQKFQIDAKDAEEMSKYGTVDDYRVREAISMNRDHEDMEDRDMLADQAAARQQRAGRNRRV